MRKVSVPGPHMPPYGGCSSSSNNGLKSLTKQSSFDLSYRKISTGIAPPPPPPTNRIREKRISIIVSGPDPNRRISSSSSSNKPHPLLALQQRYSSSFDASEFHRAYLESHFNETEITTVTNNNTSSFNPYRDPRGSARKPLFQPSLEASSKFKKKLRTKTEETQSTLLDKLSKLNFEIHELKSRTEECLEVKEGGGGPSFKTSVEEREEPRDLSHRMGEEEKSHINTNLRHFCLTTFKILTLVNECYELVKSIQSHSTAPSSLNTSSLLSQGTLLSESFRNHDFGKDISVSYFGLDWKEMTELVHEIEGYVRSLYISSRKSSLEHYNHYYGHHLRKTSSNGCGTSLSNSTDLLDNNYSGGSSSNSEKSLSSLCVSICKDLRKVRDDVLSHTEAVLRGRLSPVNKQIICEEQNRFRAYNVISTLFSHSSLERKSSFTGRIMNLFQLHGHQKKKQPVDNVWSEWFEVAVNQTQLIKRIQEI